MTSGRLGLPVFVNKAEPLAVASEVSDIVRDFDFVSAYAPDVHRYLRELGAALPPGARDTLYWTKEDFGVRPIIRISNQIIQGAARSNDPVIVTSNQVYADHYLDAAITATLALTAPDDDGRSFYMISVNRVRTRSLTGFLRSMIRSTVQNRSRDAMQKILAATKSALETEQRR